MAHSQAARRPKADKPRSLRKRNSSFPIEMEPLSSKQCDVHRLENSRRRAILEQSKDSFQTFAYRTEPTIGEEDLRRYFKGYTQRESTSASNNVQDAGLANDANKERLMQSLLPDYFVHIQDFHHYRNDIEKLMSGRPVPYLTRGKDSNFKGAVYRSKSQGDRPHKQSKGSSGYFGALPARSPISATTCERLTTETKLNVHSGPKKVSSKVLDPTRKRRNEKYNKKPLMAEQQKHVEETEVLGVLQQQLLREAADIPRESFQSIQNERFPPGPLTTPDAVSRRSSVATFLTSLDDANGCAVSTMNPDASHKLYFSPFVSRFPHMKATTEWDSRREEAKRERRALDSPGTAPWQQYRILCDAFRPCDTGYFVRRSATTGQERPRFTTSLELQYYFDVLKEMDMFPPELC